MRSDYYDASGRYREKKIASVPDIPIHLTSLRNSSHHVLMVNAPMFLNDTPSTYTFDDFISDIVESQNREDEEIIIGDILDSFYYMGISDDLIDDILSEDDGVSSEALSEVHEHIIDSFQDATYEEIGFHLHQEFLKDWKGEIGGTAKEGDTRIVKSSGCKLVAKAQTIGDKKGIVWEHEGRGKSYTKCGKERGVSDTRKKSKSGTPSYKAKAKRSGEIAKAKAKDAKRDSFILLDEIELEALSNEEFEAYSEAISTHAEQLEAFLLDGRAERLNPQKRSDCDTKKHQVLTKVTDPVTGKKVPVCRKDKNYKGTTCKKCGKGNKGEHMSASAKAKMLRTRAKGE